MAEVFLARQLGIAGTGRHVVIKRILPAFSQQPDFLKLFVGEAQLSMQLSHGNVVQVFDFGEFDEQYFLAMEWVDGLSLRELLDRAKVARLGALPPPIAVIIGIELCKALHYAHTRANAKGEPLHVVHRDVSPDNVLISWEGQVKLTDFGIARAVMEGRERTSPNVFRGRFDFAAPEQARSEPVDARSDLYSLGVLLSVLLLGENPVLGRAFEIAAGEERAPRFPLDVVDEALATTIDHCTEPRAADRPSSAQEVQQLLQAWLTTNAASATVTGLPNFLAWLAPDEVRRRGGQADVPSVFLDWLDSWQPRPWARATPVRLAAEIKTGGRALAGATEPTQRAPVKQRAPVVALGVGAVTAVVVGLVTAFFPVAALPVPPAPMQRPPTPRPLPVVRVPSAPTPVAAEPPPAPPPPPAVEREHAGPGTAQLVAPAHQRALAPGEGAMVMFDEAATIAPRGAFGFFLSFLDEKGEAVVVRTLKEPQRAPSGARKAMVWSVENVVGLPPSLAVDVSSASQKLVRVGLGARAQVPLDASHRFTFTALDPTVTYRLETVGGSVIAVLRPPARDWLVSGRTQFVGDTSPLGERLLDGPAKFTGAREVWVALVSGAPARVRLEEVGAERATNEAESVRRGGLAVAAHQPSRAVAEYKACVAAFPQSPRCALGLGDALAAQATTGTVAAYAQARDAYGTFLDLAPEHHEAGRVRAWVKNAQMVIAARAQSALDQALALASKGKDEAALVLLDACLREQPSNVLCRSPRARALERLGLSDEATRDRVVFDSSGAVAPTLKAAAERGTREGDLVELTRQLIAHGALDQAVQTAEKCVNLFPSNPVCYKLAGSAHAKRALLTLDRQESQVARSHYQRFVELAPPEDPDVPRVKDILRRAGTDP